MIREGYERLERVGQNGGEKQVKSHEILKPDERK
jgi:hypothetical protein